MSYTIMCKPYIAQTHHAECWREASHWQCAVMRVEQAQKLLEQVSEGDITLALVDKINAFLFETGYYDEHEAA